MSERPLTGKEVSALIDQRTEYYREEIHEVRKLIIELQNRCTDIEERMLRNEETK